MNYPDEDYVRFYTRDTITWLALEYEGQVVLSLMLHGRFNRSGVFDCGGHPPSHAVTLATRCPPEVARIGLERLLATKTWVVNDGQIIWPNYVYAQHCRRSDRARKRESRENTAAEAMGQTSPPVTSRHQESPTVTPKPKPKQKPKPKPKPKGGEQPPAMGSETGASEHAVGQETPPESDRAAPPEAPSLSLQEKSALWLRDPNRASYEAPKPELWPEVLELDNRIAQRFGHTRRLRITGHRDPRVAKPMALWAAGVEQRDLLDAIDGATQDKYVQDRPGQQTATWIFENAERVQELARKAPKPKVVHRPKPHTPDADEQALAARKRAQNQQALQNATPDELKKAEATAGAISNLTRDLMR